MQDRDAAAAALEAAEKAVNAAQCELAGAEAGDGRDESNRSMQERLADVRNEQVHETAPIKHNYLKDRAVIVNVQSLPTAEWVQYWV